ncbi:MAG: YggT family protein [Gemmatimonadaceae bacterium]
MNAFDSYRQFADGIRIVLLYAGIGVAAICAYDWAVRTRRINSFSRSARFFRGNIEPLMKPIERTIVRAGGVPSTAPWWALVAYVVFGIVVITLVDFGRTLLVQIIGVIQYPSELPRLALSWSLSILTIALLVRVLSTWLPVSPYSKWIRWSYVLTDWMIKPLRRIVPTVGMLDITPIVAWGLIWLVQKAFGL